MWLNLYQIIYINNCSSNLLILNIQNQTQPWTGYERLLKTKERGGLGFRNLKLFNLALLAKQGWRLQTNSSSLFCRVFQAKYFPHRSFVDANMGRNPSYAWWSLMVAQGVVWKGIRWQVGDGESIRVWCDKWVPKPSTYRVVTPEKQSPRVTLVKDLINKGCFEWDRDLVKRCFNAEDASAILGIPLSSMGRKDRLIWAACKSGKFSVKSAYELAYEEKTEQDRGDCSNDSQRKRVWRCIWQLNLPYKLRHFAWKAGRNILATKDNLKQRKIVGDDECVLCGLPVETTCHLLWFCKHARGVWDTSKLVIPFTISPSWTFLDVVQNLQHWEGS